MEDPELEEAAHIVVVNDEGQYSIWLADKEIPVGWRAVGDARTRAACLEYIEQVWTDMRPASLRSSS
jgi:MbtH protein